MKMKIPSAKPFFKEEEMEGILGDVKSVLMSGRLILGPKAQEFEELFARYIGVRHAISVNSCTTALEITLKYLEVKGKEVIVPTNTFVATLNSVIYAGGHPVLADINPESLCIDPQDLLKRITKKTKGIIVVHIAGLVCPQIEELKEICKEYNLFLIEDAAHAHGATLDEKKAGSFGDFGCFSFYPTKIMTTTIGGMITTNDDKLPSVAKSMRHHGQGEDLNQIVRLGNDWVMSEINAVLGLYQLKNLDSNIRRRNEIAKRYREGLKEVDSIKPFPVPKNIRHGYYKYPVLLKGDIDRADLIRVLKERYDIEVGGVYYPPCHLQPVFKRLFGYKEEMFPVAEEVLSKHICLPIYSQMKDIEVDYVLRCLKEEVKS
ncbi:MAG: DegT/DnrJ/EryC1/StrS family aminotransferase [bacterium]|nr:DegT/DnrJ/EryC1/StrS family aminotransferase [bacterium]